MKLFSHRMGLKPTKIKIQINSMDNDLRNGLWNALFIFYWKHAREISYKKNMDTLIKRLWVYYFKQPLDTLDNFWSTSYNKIRKYFFDCEWYEVYDFLEFIADKYPDDSVNTKFMSFCNSVLERELSAYRFVSGKITKITSEVELSEVEKALEITEPLKAVNTHLRRALDLLSDRKSPDYRNSIKESISAVESICKLITGEKKATLGQALKKIESKVKLHTALISAFEKLYGYTSNAEGIRHALCNEPNLSFEDAKFMLVSCSAFINYLIEKVSKGGIIDLDDK